MRDLIVFVYRQLFARRAFYRFNRFVFFLSLRGIGVLNHENVTLTGEDHFLGHSFSELLSWEGDLVVLDVGANEGSYARRVKELYPNARVYAFEPNPRTFARLQSRAVEYGFEALQLACGEGQTRLELYDYLEQDEGTSHASLYEDVIEQIHKRKSKACAVQVTDLDHFIEEHRLERVHLLKTDTEGHDLSVIKGAQNALKSGVIDIIQFEFNEMNVVSRTFFRDFYDLLQDYEFFRMLPDGLAPLGEYSPVFHELFAYQNIVAIPERLLSD